MGRRGEHQHTAKKRMQKKKKKKIVSTPTTITICTQFMADDRIRRTRLISRRKTNK